MKQEIQDLWAKSKPFHPLWCHLLDTAAVAHALTPRFGEIEGLPKGWIAFLVGCHDIGKADPWFQNKNADLAANLNANHFDLPRWHAGAAEYLRLFRHEARSHEWLLTHLKNGGWGTKARLAVAKAIIGHHGDWAPTVYPRSEEENPLLWATLRDELGAMLWQTIEPEPCVLEQFPHASNAGARLAAYVILADWIASNDQLFCYEKLPRQQPPSEYFEAACARAHSVVSQMKLDAAPLENAAAKPRFQEVWPNIKKPRPLQTMLEAKSEELAPGLCFIEAPMGEGKTEAAIYLAQLWISGQPSRGLYFALPTQATSNAMHKRYAKFLKRYRPGREARLMHGGAWLLDQTPAELELLPELDAQNHSVALGQARTARDWFRPMRRALLSSEGVGTVDQALLCALRVKFGPLRLLGLSQKTLVVDEVHAYDQFMNVLLERLLEWCRALEVNVLLLSATLSQSQKLSLARAYAGAETDLAPLENADATKAPYPLLSFVPREKAAFILAPAAAPKRARKLPIDTEAGLLNDAQKTAILAAQTVKNGGCLCVLANTVKAAQEIFAALEELQKCGELAVKCDISLFHARFRAEARAEIEAQTLRKFGKPEDETQDINVGRPECAILVATQVVEQSLDVDFDFLISQLAPVDLLLQRAGRLWRHERGPRPTASPILTVLTPDENQWEFGASGAVYAPEILLRSLALCHEKPIWRLPSDFRPLIETCYDRARNLGDFAARPGFAKALEEAEKARDAETALAKNEAKIHLWVQPKADSFEPVVRGAEEADEDSGQKPKFLVAQTRRGNESQAVLILWKPEHKELVALDADNATKRRDEQKFPSRALLVEIFSQKVGLPRWWLTGVAALEGFEEIQDGKSFLRGHKLLLLSEENGSHIWKGRDTHGEFSIVDDPKQGLSRHSVQKPEVEEADGGLTGG